MSKIQDALESVGDLTSHSTSLSISLSWKPPFSLNLTTAEPDIVYCIDIIRSFSVDGQLESEHLITNCSIYQPSYNFSFERPDPRDVFQFIVTPRSNVEGATNGSPNQINATFSPESK